jgi:hypothetical protein
VLFRSKIWYADRKFGFATANVNHKYEDIYFSSKALQRTSDELKLLAGKPQIFGDLNNSEKGFYLTNVIVD